MVTSCAGSHRSLARVASVGGVLVLLAECRTPPPLPRTPPDPEVPGVAPVPMSAAKTETPAPAEKPVEKTPAEPDYAAEQAVLRERYGTRRPQSSLRGEASYYGAAFAGRRTANGEVFEPKRYTAAHRTLPFGTVVRVTRVDTGAVVYVRINDRGPYGKKRRILDLSEAAAASLDMLRRGIAEVLVEVVERGKAPSKKKKS